MIGQLILDYLKQNNVVDTISDIITDYRTSCIIRRDIQFKESEFYNEENMSSECYMGDITLNDKSYRLICDLSLEEGEILFN